MHVLGIDIGSLEYHTHLLDAADPTRSGGAIDAFANSHKGHHRLAAWLEKHGARAESTLVVLEATGVYWQGCAHHLHRLGFAVSVVNPAQIKFYAKSTLRRGKTDRMDAEVIAQYGATMRPKPWKPAEQALEAIQFLVREREAVVALLTQEKGRLHALRHRHEADEVVVRLVEERISLLEGQLEALERALKGRFAASASLQRDLELLTSVPGFGFVAAATVLAETNGFATLESGRQLAAYAGLSPAPRQSGTSGGYARISKVGNPRLRRIAYMAAVGATRSRSGLRAFYLGLKQRGKPSKVALVALARKLLCVGLAVVKSGRPYDPGYTRPAEAAPASP
jgi:transposase